MGARENGAHEEDSRVSHARSVFPSAHDFQAPATQATLSIVPPRSRCFVKHNSFVPYTFIYLFIYLLTYFVKIISDK